MNADVPPLEADAGPARTARACRSDASTSERSPCRLPPRRVNSNVPAGRLWSAAPGASSRLTSRMSSSSAPSLPRAKPSWIVRWRGSADRQSGGSRQRPLRSLEKRRHGLALTLCILDPVHRLPERLASLRDPGNTTECACGRRARLCPRRKRRIAHRDGPAAMRRSARATAAAAARRSSENARPREISMAVPARRGRS